MSPFGKWIGSAEGMREIRKSPGKSGANSVGAPAVSRKSGNVGALDATLNVVAGAGADNAISGFAGGCRNANPFGLTATWEATFDKTG